MRELPGLRNFWSRWHNSDVMQQRLAQFIRYRFHHRPCRFQFLSTQAVGTTVVRLWPRLWCFECDRYEGVQQPLHWGRRRLPSGLRFSIEHGHDCLLGLDQCRPQFCVSVVGLHYSLATWPFESEKSAVRRETSSLFFVKRRVQQVDVGIHRGSAFLCFNWGVLRFDELSLRGPLVYCSSNPTTQRRNKIRHRRARGL